MTESSGRKLLDALVCVSVCLLVSSLSAEPFDNDNSPEEFKDQDHRPMVKVDRLKNVILCLEVGGFRSDQNNTDLQVLTGYIGLSLEHGLSRQCAKFSLRFVFGLDLLIWISTFDQTWI